MYMWWDVDDDGDYDCEGDQCYDENSDVDDEGDDYEADDSDDGENDIDDSDDKWYSL